MLPELVRMACTAFGAYGSATPDGGLIQLRSLDFGSGPFANYTVLQVHHPPEPAQAFVSLSFPGFVGVITGVSEKGIGVSYVPREPTTRPAPTPSSDSFLCLPCHSLPSRAARRCG
jgi:hypothetical protein